MGKEQFASTDEARRQFAPIEWPTERPGWYQVQGVVFANGTDQPAEFVGAVAMPPDTPPAQYLSTHKERIAADEPYPAPPSRWPFKPS